VVPSNPGEPPPLRPPSVPIHNNRYVTRDFTGLKETLLKLSVVACGLFKSQACFLFFEDSSNLAKNLIFFA
jgi:hypothetical protein